MDISEEPRFSTTHLAMTMGALTAALMLLVSLTGWQILGWIVLAIGIYYAMRVFRLETGDVITYSRALITGVQTSFFASIILAFVTFIAVTIDPSQIENMLILMEQKLITFGIASELAETVVQQWREMLSPVVVAVFSVFTYTIMGGLLSIVLAFLARSIKPDEFAASES